MGYQNLKKRIKLNEGFSLKAYKDQLGYLTVGYGHLILSDEKILLKKNIHKKELEEIFEKDFEKALSDFNKTLKPITSNKKEADLIIEMIFQLGIKGCLKFKNLVSKDVYKTFESAINNGSNNPNSQFYSLVIDGVDDAKVENGNITIGVNFISEQILSDNEDDIVKNKDTWVFEKPETSKGPVWMLVST